jgi:hypothetical protein
MSAYGNDVVGLLLVPKLDDRNKRMFDGDDVFEDARRAFFKDLKEGIACALFRQEDGDIHVATMRPVF